MVNDSVIPVSALGFQYYKGPVVTVLSSKTSSKLKSVFYLFYVIYMSSILKTGGTLSSISLTTEKAPPSKQFMFSLVLFYIYSIYCIQIWLFVYQFFISYILVF